MLLKDPVEVNQLDFDSLDLGGGIALAALKLLRPELLLGFSLLLLNLDLF